MCPECGSPLVALELNGVEIDYCPECGGTWLDKGELAFIAQLAGVKPGGMTKALYETAASGPGKGRCPRCNARLKAVVIRGDTDINLDRCPRGHGLYFDKGEMQAVVNCLAGCMDDEKAAVAAFFADMFKYELSNRTKGE